jgi:hypothetical protein
MYFLLVCFSSAARTVVLSGPESKSRDPEGQVLQKATALFISQVHNSHSNRCYSFLQPDVASLTQENGRLNENRRAIGLRVKSRDAG